MFRVSISRMSCAGAGKVHQAGSHIILETSKPIQHRIAIPEHDPIWIGMFIAILRSVARHKGVTRDAIVETL